MNPSTFVLFGASGDLTRRKLVPALYRLHLRGRLPEGSTIVGVSRTAFEDEDFRNHLEGFAQEHLPEHYTAESWDSFAQSIRYVAGDVTASDDLAALRDRLDELDQGHADRVLYLATAPSLYEPALETIGESGLADEQADRGSRVVIEKPFGTDEASARRLNEVIHRWFSEDQVYRIDHYLGKETVQNLLVLRFANSIFEPVWNRNYVDHVQITVAEEVLVGSRGDYYDHAGVLRDMFQNHLLQLLMITAMEAPARYEADAIRNEKVKILEAVRPFGGDDFLENTIRGQYAGYRDEDGVDATSETATFAALKLFVDNWRWQGVPFYLRSGKGMSCRTTQIVVQFQEPPHMLFGDRTAFDANRLVVQIQPAEGIQVHFQTKVPDAGMRLQMTELDFDFRRAFPTPAPDAYERLLQDVAAGDASLFARSDEVELAWGIVDPILEAWQESTAPALEIYEPGGWGPTGCTDWMRGQIREWFDACPVLH